MIIFLRLFIQFCLFYCVSAGILLGLILNCKLYTITSTYLFPEPTMNLIFWLCCTNIFLIAAPIMIMCITIRETDKQKLHDDALALSCEIVRMLSTSDLETIASSSSNTENN
jgi:hypothetical protein